MGDDVCGQMVVRNSDKKYRELAAWNQHIDDILLQVEAAVDAQGLVQDEVARKKAETAELELARQQLQHKRDVLKALEQKEVQINRQVQRAEEKNNQIRKQGNSRYFCSSFGAIFVSVWRLTHLSQDCGEQAGVLPTT